MKTQLFGVSDLSEASRLLRAGELVAFPTETVYGLGANALEPDAIQKIYIAKGRPSDNPLIVHVADVEDVGRVAKSVPPLARELMREFWPGPLTIVLPKRDDLSTLVTAGLDSVAGRIPNHPVALELIRGSGVPVAAPSANRSGRPSSTTWQAVAQDLDGLIAGIVVDRPTQWGLESTVVDITSNPPRLLRPGGISLESLREVAPGLVALGLGVATDASNSPGLRHRHYQPQAKVMIVEPNGSAEAIEEASRSGTISYIGLNAPFDATHFTTVLVCESLADYASKLFDFFRSCDTHQSKYVCCESVPEHGLGVALMDRLRRASSL